MSTAPAHARLRRDDSRTLSGRRDGEHGRAHETVLARMRPAQQLQFALRVLDHGRAGLDPVAGIAVEDVPRLPQIRAMDMAAENAVVTERGGVPDCRIFVVLDVLQALADRELQALG